LIRGKFGVTAECAIIISQLDPMISSMKDKYYTEKEGKKNYYQRGRANRTP
jgi:hypothetical protein